jgi:heme-degrading monooxygenase HmoA
MSWSPFEAVETAVSPGADTGRMIARIWRGATRLEDAEEYVRYVERTGIEGYRSTPGNRGAWVMWRPAGERAEIVTMSLWESRADVEGFAGADIDRAVFYPEDDRYLVSRELTVEHYEVGGDGRTA